MHLGPPVPTGAAFRAGNPGSRRAPGLVRREEALLLCGPGISPLLTQLPPPVPSGRAQALVPPAAQAHNSSPSRKAARAPSLSEPGSRPPGPQEGGGGATHCTADSGRQGWRGEPGVQAPTPLFKTSAVSTLCPTVSCKATGVGGRGAESESCAQLSCPGRGPGPTRTPGRLSLARSMCSLSLHRGPRTGRMCEGVFVAGGGGAGGVFGTCNPANKRVPQTLGCGRGAPAGPGSRGQLCISAQSLALNSEL